MPEIKDDKLSRIDAEIAKLMEQRQQRLDIINDPIRWRISEIYKELTNLFDELHELGDDTHFYDDEYDKQFPVTFEGKFFKFNDGETEAK